MTRKSLAILFLVPFSVLTAWALMDGGITGILAFHKTSGGWQVFTDLVIALILVLTFLVPHARSRGRNPWPWIAASFVVGMFSPLVYLLARTSDR